MIIIKNILHQCLKGVLQKRGAFLSSVLVVLFSGCSTTKFVPDGGMLLKSVKIKSESKSVDVNALQPYLSQHPNSKWFSMFKIPLGVYNMSGRDSTKWGNKVLRRLGEAPVVYDSLKTLKSCHDMTVAMRNMGYMQAVVDYDVTKKKRKALVTYRLSPGRKYTIDSVEYVVDDAAVAALLNVDDAASRGLRRGMDFSNANLENERKRITQTLTDSGYFKFNRDFIHFVADSVGKDCKVDVELHLSQYRPNNNALPAPHRKYFINRIFYRGADSTGTHLRQRVLENNTALREGEAYSASALQRTYNNFARLQAVRYTNIHFTELPDTNLLDCNIQLSTNKPNTVSFQPEGTNTAGDLGAAASLTYENRNLFRGSETLSIQLRAAFEAITGLEGYQNQNYEESADFVAHRCAVHGAADGSGGEPPVLSPGGHRCLPVSQPPGAAAVAGGAASHDCRVLYGRAVRLGGHSSGHRAFAKALRLPAPGDRALGAFRVSPAAEGQVALQNQGGGHSVHGVFPLLAVVVVVRKNLMGFDGGPALIPQVNRQAGGRLQLPGKVPVQLRPRPLGAVHIPGEAHDQLLHLVLPGQAANFRHRLLRNPAVDDGGGANQAAQQVRNGDACPGVAIINCHNPFHAVFLLVRRGFPRCSSVLRGFWKTPLL